MCEKFENTIQLYHGTSAKSWALIQRQGIKTPVWFTEDIEIAKNFVELNEMTSNSYGVLLYVNVPRGGLENLTYDNGESAYLFTEKERDLLVNVKLDDTVF